MQTRKWDDENGVTHYTPEIIAKSMEMLGGKKYDDTPETTLDPESPMNGNYGTEVPF
jgi:single-stranded DNA-binding protein